MALKQDTTATLSDCKLETTLWDLYGGRIGSIEANQDNAKKKKKKLQLNQSMEEKHSIQQKENLRCDNELTE